MAIDVRSVRRVTDNVRHNAFTGACWFKGNLYIAYREGDAHVCPFGRLVVLRSRDNGYSWDHVAVARGPGDTRDAHLYTDGNRLYVVGFIFIGMDGKSGADWTKLAVPKRLRLDGRWRYLDGLDAIPGHGQVRPMASPILRRTTLLRGI